jgi:hypothetical protein|nr:MAG TPA: hypothetical protein [Caudoviricetes sp.]
MARPVDTIIAKAEKAAMRAVENMANAVANQMCEYAKLSALEWYDDYELRSNYKRHMSLVDVYERVYENHGSYYLAGVRCDSSFMNEEHRLDAGSLFDITWVKGFHGNPAWGATITQSPYEKMCNYKASMNLGSYAGAATKGAIKNYFR